MADLLDILKTPQGFGMLMSGIASAGTGNQKYLQTNVLLNDAFEGVRQQRDALELRKRRQEAFARLPALMEPMAPDADPAMAADRRRQTWALLTDVAPEQTAKGLIDSFFSADKAPDARTSTDYNDLTNMLRRPPTQEEMVKYKTSGGQGGATQLDMMVKGLNIQKLQQDIKAGAATETDKKTDKDQKFGANQAALTRNFGRLQHLSDLADGIRGTVVESGTLPDLRRQMASGAGMLGRWAGVDTGKLEKDVSSAELLSKGLNSIVQDTLQRFGNNISDSRQTLLQNSSANPSMKADSIRSLLADIGETMQDEAMISGYDVNQKELGNFISRMREPLPPLDNQTVIDVPGAVKDAKAAGGRAIDAAGSAATALASEGKNIVRRAADIGRMSKAQIGAIDPSEITAWTAEQRAALDRRMRDLGF